MKFSPTERHLLTTRPTGGPPLELTAWFESPPPPGAIARRLGHDPAVAFGPCAPDSFAFDLARAEPSGRVEIGARGDTQCNIVLAIPGPPGADSRGKILLQLAEYRSFDPSEANAWLHPDTVSIALGYGDWHAPRCDFAWSNPEGAAQMAPLYRRLAAWWAQLASPVSDPGCTGRWLGYEGCDDGARELASQRPGHLITEWIIAERGPWPAPQRLTDHHAAIPLAAIASAEAQHR